MLDIDHPAAPASGFQPLYTAPDPDDAPADDDDTAADADDAAEVEDDNQINLADKWPYRFVAGAVLLVIVMIFILIIVASLE